MANAKLKTVNIKGREYVMVNERIKAFRKEYPTWSLVSQITDLTDNRCVIRAEIYDEERRCIATGHAYEKEGSSPINKTSFIENCETSAWGRALANLGIGIDASICSAEELAIAISQQETPEQIAERKLNGEDVQLPSGEDFAKAMNNTKDITKPRGKNASTQQVTMIKSIAERIGQPIDKICTKYKVKGLEDLTPAQATEVIEKLKGATK